MSSKGVDRPDPRALFDAHAPFVVRALRYLGVAERDVHDVAQEVLAHVLQDLPGWDSTRGALRTWIYGYCLRAAANHRRLARHRREALHAELPELAHAADQERAIERRQAREALLEALSTLSDELREVFVLHGVEELAMREVTAILGIPLQTGYSRYEAARRDLRIALSRRAR
jgi:RNA polymerase sigma-70 factor (ECF subfamily)